MRSHPMSKLSVTTAISSPKLMAWDTTFWKQRVGRATSLNGLSEWAIENTVGLMCLLVDSINPREIQEAEERGFRFMDLRVTLTMPTTPRTSWARLARAEDTSRLKEMARDAFHLTRFYADPTLDDSRCDDLYAEWTRSSCAGGADIVLIVDRDDEPAGYITVNRDGDTSEIGLIAVTENLRGQHLGTVLVNAAIDWAYAHDAKQMSVVTQGRNIGALRTFEGCGFRVSQTQVWMHRRYEEGK